MCTRVVLEPCISNNKSVFCGELHEALTTIVSVYDAVFAYYVSQVLIVVFFPTLRLKSPISIVIS